MLMPKDPPPSAYAWGTDKLSEYLRRSEQNTYAAASNLGGDYQRLVAIHEFWLEICEAFQVVPDAELLAMWFLQMANSAWTAAIRVGLGGQPIESRPLLRSTLEHAAYALHFTRHPDLKLVWINRHDTPQSRDATRKGFSTNQVANTLRTETEALAATYSNAYEELIDFGGHPNERALSSRLTLTSEPGVNLSAVTQLTDDHRDYLFLARSCARVALIALEIFGRIYEVKFRLASFDVKLARLKAGV
jgi:hypothetical protein